MELTEIEQLCQDFLLENYGMGLAIPVKINGRFTTTLGVFNYKKLSKIPVSMEFSKKFMAKGSREDKIAVIKHECIHYALFVLGKPYKDGEAFFEAELVRHDAVATEVIDMETERNVRVYQCDCREHIYRQLVSPKICLNCKRPLVYKERRRQLV